MKKIILLIFITVILGLTSCSTKNNQNSNSSTTPSDTTNSNALVIYFSATNHTKKVAETISNHLNAPIYELEPQTPYTTADLNYSNRNSRVVQEHLITQNGERVNVALNTTHFDEFEKAEYIFLGAPVWWQQLSWVIENFVIDNDFSNKTIIPFGTSSSSSFNLNNLTPLTADDTNVVWLSPQRFSSSVSSSNVIKQIDSLNLNI